MTTRDKIHPNEKLSEIMAEFIYSKLK